MRLWIFGHNKRPEVDSQNTGRDAYMRPLGVGTVSVNGMGGANNYRSLSPVSQTSFNVPLIATASVTGRGNDGNTNPALQPLIDENGNVNIGFGIGNNNSNIPQF